MNQKIILEAHDAECRIQQLEAALEAAGLGKVVPFKAQSNGLEPE
jgi:hypothetical protein